MLVLFSFLCGCQEDEVTVINPPDDQVIKPNSEETTLLQRVALKDGSSDNIIDHASCLSLLFPLKVTVNGIEVFINSDDDLGAVEDILDEFIDDDDKIDIQFPITVTLENYAQVIVENQGELNDLIEGCIEGGLDDDIECLDFKYPVKVSLYNSGNQVAEVITIGNDEELYNFFIDLKNDDLVNFIFPVSVILSTGTEALLYDNNSLRDFIKDTIDDCDEDDDDDHNDDDAVDEIAFQNVMTDGEWIITYYFEDREDKTSKFENFSLVFSADGTFTATNGVSAFQGTWQIKDDDNGLELEFDIEEESLKDLDDNWKLIDFDDGKIRLRDSSGGNTTYLTLERP